MNELSFRPGGGYVPPHADQGTRSDDEIDLQRLWTVVRRNLKIVFACMTAALAVGWVYLQFAPPVYSTETRVLVDERIGQVAGAASMVANDIQMDTRIASEIEILKSMRLALTVVDMEGLADDETFQNQPLSPVSRLLAPFRELLVYLRGPRNEPTRIIDPVQVEAQRREDAAARLRREIAVERVERSSVIGILYESYDPQLVYRVAKAYADAFLGEQKLADAAASTDATAWMKTRLTQLAEQQKAAALAVEDFRSRNGLSVARGELVSEQRVSDLTNQIAMAQSELARAKAQSEQLAAIIASGTENAVKSIALSSSDISDTAVDQTRGRYIEIVRRIAQIETDFGPDHPQAIQLRKEEANLAARLFQQLQDLETRYRNDFEVATSRLATLEGIITRQTGQNLQSGQAMVELRKLEQDAATISTVYINFMSRYEEALQRQNSPVTDLRVISTASVPQEASGPRFVTTMLTFAVLGILLGAASSVLREFNERSFRTGEEVTRHLGLRMLGYLPKLSGRARKKGLRKTGARKGRWPFELGVGLETGFAETLRNVAHAFTETSNPSHSKVIGVISVLPGEGKTTFSAQFARLLATSGFKTILIDADLRRPALSRALVEEPASGLTEAINGESWRSLIRIEPTSGLPVLPAGRGREALLGTALLSSPRMTSLLHELRQEFEYIVVDLPPIGPVTDAKWFHPHANGFVLVLRWGQTPWELARSVLGDAPELASKIVGVVLNATDFRVLKRYGARGSREHAYQTYQSYYTNPL